MKQEKQYCDLTSDAFLQISTLCKNHLNTKVSGTNKLCDLGVDDNLYELLITYIKIFDIDVTPEYLLLNRLRATLQCIQKIPFNRFCDSLKYYLRNELEIYYYAFEDMNYINSLSNLYIYASQEINNYCEIDSDDKGLTYKGLCSALINIEYFTVKNIKNLDYIRLKVSYDKDIHGNILIEVDEKDSNEYSLTRYSYKDICSCLRDLKKFLSIVGGDYKTELNKIR